MSYRDEEVAQLHKKVADLQDALADARRSKPAPMRRVDWGKVFGRASLHISISVMLYLMCAAISADGRADNRHFDWAAFKQAHWYLGTFLLAVNLMVLGLASIHDSSQQP